MNIFMGVALIVMVIVAFGLGICLHKSHEEFDTLRLNNEKNLEEIYELRDKYFRSKAKSDELSITVNNQLLTIKGLEKEIGRLNSELAAKENPTVCTKTRLISVANAPIPIKASMEVPFSIEKHVSDEEIEGILLERISESIRPLVRHEAMVDPLNGYRVHFAEIKVFKED